MAQWAKVLALQACQTHVKEKGEKTLYKVVLCTLGCILPHIIHTIIIK